MNAGDMKPGNEAKLIFLAHWISSLVPRLSLCENKKLYCTASNRKLGDMGMRLLTKCNLRNFLAYQFFNACFLTCTSQWWLDCQYSSESSSAGLSSQSAHQQQGVCQFLATQCGETVSPESLQLENPDSKGKKVVYGDMTSDNETTFTG